MFPCEFCEISKNTFSYRTPLVAASFFVAIEFYVFLVEAFQFSKFHENVDRIDRGNFKREVLTWHSWSKIHKITQKSDLKFCKLLFFVDNYADCLQIFQNISEIVKFEKALNSGKLDWQNLLEKFLHISKFNFAIVFSSKIFKSCNVFGLTCFLH